MTDEELDKNVSKIPGFDKADPTHQCMREMLTKQFVKNKLPGILNAINGVADQEEENNTESQNDEEIEKKFYEMSTAEKLDFLRQQRGKMRWKWWQEQNEPMYEDLKRVAVSSKAQTNK